MNPWLLLLLLLLVVVVVVVHTENIVFFVTTRPMELPELGRAARKYRGQVGTTNVQPIVVVVVVVWIHRKWIAPPPG